MNLHYPEQLLKANIQLQEQFTTAKSKHLLKCLICTHQWNATPISKIQAFKKTGYNGCPNCSNIRKDKKNEDKRKLVFEKFNEKGIEILDKNYNGEQTTTKKIKVLNKKCGHEFMVAPGNILHRGVKCPKCNTKRKSEMLRQRNKNNHDVWAETADEWSLYKSSVTTLTEQTFKQYKNQLNPNNKIRGLAGVEGVYQLDHIFPVRWGFENNVPEEAIANISNLQFIPWEQNIQKSARLLSTYVPKSILPYYKESSGSVAVLEIMALLNENNIDYNQDTSPLDPYKINFYMPELNLAIRIYDIQRETEQVTQTNKIQSNILKLANVKGIRVIQIFSDEWNSNPILIKQKILHLCKLGSNKRIHARKCSISVISSSEQKDTFLDLFHNQGSDSSTIKIGAFHPNNEKRLIAVMTFSHPRVLLGSKKSSTSIQWELSRFATDTTIRVPGIASKLLTYFKNHYEWDKIYSYADKRWSDGNVYIKLGFNEDHHNRPGYWYVVNGKRMHRWGFRKDNLKHKLENYDSSLTEYQNMLANGIDRIWDCGTIKYSMKNERV